MWLVSILGVLSFYIVVGIMIDRSFPDVVDKVAMGLYKFAVETKRIVVFPFLAFKLGKADAKCLLWEENK
ncbi:hypothetical protein [Pediococcus pentosaceus]|uniref:hypothetical protein n=1 Tax=Pediococcus pentosaceus TaxID=1255 RepID=UPI0039829913